MQQSHVPLCGNDHAPGGHSIERRRHAAAAHHIDRHTAAHHTHTAHAGLKKTKHVQVSAERSPAIILPERATARCHSSANPPGGVLADSTISGPS